MQTCQGNFPECSRELNLQMSLHLEHGFEGDRLRVTLKVLSQLAQEVQTAFLRVLVLVDPRWTSVVTIVWLIRRCLLLDACATELALLCVDSRFKQGSAC